MAKAREFKVDRFPQQPMIRTPHSISQSPRAQSDHGDTDDWHADLHFYGIFTHNHAACIVTGLCTLQRQQTPLLTLPGYCADAAEYNDVNSSESCVPPQGEHLPGAYARDRASWGSITSSVGTCTSSSCTLLRVSPPHLPMIHHGSIYSTSICSRPNHHHHHLSSSPSDTQGAIPAEHAQL